MGTQNVGLLKMNLIKYTRDLSREKYKTIGRI
jgi:hypothetical protein